MARVRQSNSMLMVRFPGALFVTLSHVFPDSILGEIKQGHVPQVAFQVRRAPFTHTIDCAR